MPNKLVELEVAIRSKKIQSKVEPENEEIVKEIEEMEAIYKEEKALWEKEVLGLKAMSELKNQIDQLKFQMAEAERQARYEEAGKIKYSQLPELQNKLESISNNWILTEKDIAQVVSRQTGIPLQKILKSKQDNILDLEKYLLDRVYGQDEAIKEICATLMTSHAGLSDESRPLGSFLMLGPSGVGKTETAKAIAEFLFNTERHPLRRWNILG